jgi:hypothetical protein
MRKGFLPVWDDKPEKKFPEAFTPPVLLPPTGKRETIQELAQHSRLPFHDGKVG